MRFNLAGWIGAVVANGWITVFATPAAGQGADGLWPPPPASYHHSSYAEQAQGAEPASPGDAVLSQAELTALSNDPRPAPPYASPAPEPQQPPVVAAEAPAIPPTANLAPADRVQVSQPSGPAVRAGAPWCAAPNMIGDFFGPGFRALAGGASDSSVPSPTDIAGRFRVQDNNSARVQDRVYFEYTHFHNTTIATRTGLANTGLTPTAVDVNRFAFGLEKTLLNGMASVGIVLPMATTVSSDLAFAGAGAPFVTDTSSYEFGNLGLTTKVVLARTCDWTCSAGLGVTVPTADDIFIADGAAATYEIQNESVHVIPFLAALYNPHGSRWFAHAFVTLDVDASGNTLAVNGTANTRVYDATLLSGDLALGRWVYRDRDTALAWSAEMHYTVATSETGQSAGQGAGNPAPDLFDESLSLLSATMGAHARFRQTTITAAYSTPVTSDDRTYDGGFRLMINRNF